MDNEYKPKPLDMIYPTAAFGLGTLALSIGIDLLMIGMYVIGGVLIIWISIAGMLEPIIEYHRERRMQMDAAKDLSLEQMAALGISTRDVPQVSETRIVFEDQHGQLQRQSTMTLPVSEIKLKSLCSNLVDGVPFSRNAVTVDRKLLKESEYDKVFKDWMMRGFIAYKDAAHSNLGVELTTIGRVFIWQKAGLPSPTPNMEMAENAA